MQGALLTALVQMNGTRDMRSSLYPESMCGRFAFIESMEALEDRFEVFETAGTLPEPSKNIAPTQRITIIAEPCGQRRAGPAYWSLIPPWERRRKLPYSTFNARSETVLSSRVFRDAALHQRCIIPADGYYEWAQKAHQPYFFHTDQLLGIAGLYTWWRPTPAQSWELTTTILTREAIPTVAWCHDRMPVLIPQELQDKWLNPQIDGNEIVPVTAAQGQNIAQTLTWEQQAPQAA